MAAPPLTMSRRCRIVRSLGLNPPPPPPPLFMYNLVLLLVVVVVVVVVVVSGVGAVLVLPL
jgi:hypothetical protein